MAITKIHPIKTTLNLSIDYICDPSKTDEEILISSFLCGHKTAAIEFAKTKEKMNSQSKNLARHLIQSFMPGEVSPELAHTIGQELCDKHLLGKYEYVLTTHVDKGHIHNHIIFSNVSHQDGKAYISNKKSYHQIRNISDSLCKEHQLSIATESNTSKTRNKTNGSSYKEYQERKKGNSYKAKLQYAIDLAIRKASDWDDFLRILQSQGYEIKHGKHISFRAVGQERFTRSKTLGDDYLEDRIKGRIELTVSTRQDKIATFRKSRSKVVDISSNKLAGKSAGFARWLKLQNLKVISKSWSEITDASDIQSFYNSIEKIHDELTSLQTDIRNIENEIKEKQDLIRNIATYKRYREINSKYLSSSDKDAFFRAHERELIMYEAAKHSLKQTITDTLLGSQSAINHQIDELNFKLHKYHGTLVTTKEKIFEVSKLRKDLDTYLRSGNSLQYNNSK